MRSTRRGIILLILLIFATATACVSTAMPHVMPSAHAKLAAPAHYPQGFARALLVVQPTLAPNAPAEPITIPVATPTFFPTPGPTAGNTRTGIQQPLLPIPIIVPKLVLFPKTASPSAAEAALPGPATPGLPIASLRQPSQAVALAPSWRETDNYLILGTDHRPKDGNWRTDTIMIVGIDHESGRAAVLSIPRDLYVEIPGSGWGRINTVDYLGEKVIKVEGGGPALVSATLEKAIGISTNHWIRIRMDGFTRFVDAVGGVTVTLDCPFVEPIFDLDTRRWEYFILPAGSVYLDGEDAYWFVRLRLTSSDIARAQRQRQFLWALRDQVLSTDSLGKLPQLWSAFSSSFTTDLKLLDMLNLARIGLSLDTNKVRAGGIALQDLQQIQTAQGASVLRIGDPARIMAVVDGVWNASPMVAANRQDNTKCKPIPQGRPIFLEATPTPIPLAPTAQPNEDAAADVSEGGK